MKYDTCHFAELDSLPERWLITGVAGFIGSHLLEALLGLGKHVVGLDNFKTGKHENLYDVRNRLHRDQWHKFRLIEGDIRSRDVCEEAVRGADVVSHQAALNSVPRSIVMPVEVCDVNVTGFVNVIHAAAAAGVSRFVYASSSSVYGSISTPGRQEHLLGEPLSPYAASKRATEGFAAAYHLSIDLPVIGLRYFNVFGPRQNPHGPYSAVIPRWINLLLEGESPVLYGDGTQRRDFTYVQNVVWANLLAVQAKTKHSVVNVGTARSTTLRTLYELVRAEVAVAASRPNLLDIAPLLGPPRVGDAASSVADVELAAELLSYRPIVDLERGIRRAVRWFADTPDPSQR